MSVKHAHTHTSSHHRQECASLRAELSHRYSDDSHTALMELAGLKDGAMREAQGRWEEERKGLVKKVRVCVGVYMGREVKIQCFDAYRSSSLSSILCVMPSTAIEVL